MPGLTAGRLRIEEIEAIGTGRHKPLVQPLDQFSAVGCCRRLVSGVKEHDELTVLVIHDDVRSRNVTVAAA